MKTPNTSEAAEVQLPYIQPFDITFGPAHEAVRLLAEIANGNAGPLVRQRAASVVNAWADSLATSAQIAAVETSDDLEVDDDGACVSVDGDGDGFFIQTWTWVGYDDYPELDPKCGEDKATSEQELDSTIQ